MVSFYIRKIENGEIDTRNGEPWKWTSVPPKWREGVKTRLVNDGYILNEDGSATKVNTNSKAVV